MIRQYVIGFLLHLANRDADLCTKEKFYPCAARVELAWGDRSGKAKTPELLNKIFVVGCSA